MVHIEISVYIHGIILEYTERSTCIVELEKGKTVSDLIHNLGIQYDLVGTVQLNRERIVGKDYQLQNNDRIDLYPFFGGG